MRYRDRLGRHVDVVQFDALQDGTPLFMAEVVDHGEVVGLIDMIIGDTALTLLSVREGWSEDIYNCPFCGTPGVRAGISHACN